MRIFHIATVADWQSARESGAYTTSTRGRTLAEEGFIHASRGDQWQGVRERFYADVEEPLLLLVIERDRLTSPVLDEPVPDSHETFPHVYGPIDVDAVVSTILLDGRPVVTDSFSRLFLTEVLAQVLLATVVLVAAAVGLGVGLAAGADWTPLLGIVVGLAVGVLVARVLARRRRR